MNKLLCASVLLIAAAAFGQPAVPLLAHDPYISVWSMSERLTDDWPKHWSGAVMGMTGMVWVDGKAFRWCGPMPQNVAAAKQVGRFVGLNSTTFVFEAGGVELRVIFSTPRGMVDTWELGSAAVSSISFGAKAIDGGLHDVRVYLDVTGEWCTNSSDDLVSWSRHRVGGMDVLSMGRTEQPVLRHAGDRRKIDWGRVYLSSVGGSVGVGGHDRTRRSFAEKGEGLESDDLRMPRPANDDWPVLASVLNLGTIAEKESELKVVLVGFDEDFAIELFDRPLRPLWRAPKNGESHDMSWELLEAAKYVSSRQEALDAIAEAKFIAKAEEIGGEDYAKTVTLAYRQVLAGHGIAADWDGSPLMFSKENTSNGCIATVDVIYPACPFFLYHNPEMLKAQLLPLLEYAASPRWKFPFAPHDLGTYPKANGQVYGGGERTEENQMPVEESGNMLIMLAALAKVERNADFSKPYLGILEQWAGYLKAHGLDPANQLCTDDFAGHLARNANLSAKTCVALGAYAQILEAAGYHDDAGRWRNTAEMFAATWKTMAAGTHATVLVFGQEPGTETWSQKYNLIWDRVLGLGLFEPAVFEKEVAWYRTQLRPNGLPLDSRRTYTKLDWTVWSACLTRNRNDFDAIMAPAFKWMNASPPPSRVPLSDWYETTDGTSMGMHARTVVGGVWMPLLMDKMGLNWVERDTIQSPHGDAPASDK